MPAPQKWFLVREQKRYGPYVGAQLKQFAASGHLLPSDQLVQEGTSRLLFASQFPDLFPTLPTTIVAHPQKPPPVAILVPSGSAEQPRQRLSWKLRLTAAGFVLVVLGISSVVISQRFARDPSVAKKQLPAENKPEKGSLAQLPIDTSAVFAEGVGANADEALKDAFRQAIRRVVGVYVNEETLVKNDAIITDQVLTQSDGFIKKYEEVESKQEKGLYRVKIRAAVEFRTVAARLAQAKVYELDVQKYVEEEKVRMVKEKTEALNSLAEAMTKEEARKDARALLKHLLRDCPQGLVEARVIGGITREKTTDDKVMFSVKVRFEIKKEAYDSLLPRLCDVLEKLSTTHGDRTMVASKKDRYHRINTINGKQPPLGNIVYVNTHQTKDLSRTEWNWYSVDGETLRVVSARASVLFRVKLSFLDDAGHLITADRFPLQTVGLFSANPMVALKEDQTFEEGKCFFSPFLLDISDTPTDKQVFMDFTTYRDENRSLTLPFEDFQRLKTVKLELSVEDN